jgi:hypothetical protein
MAEELLAIAGRIEGLIPDKSAGQGELGAALLGVKNQVAEVALKAQSLAAHVRDFSLLTSGWLATARLDIEQLQHEHGVHITLEEGADPDQLFSYATAYRLSECVHAALSTLIALYGARHMSLALSKQGSMLVINIRHDGREGDGAVSNILPAARLYALVTELGAELTTSRAGELNVLRLSVDLSAPAASPPH